MMNTWSDEDQLALDAIYHGNYSSWSVGKVPNGDGCLYRVVLHGTKRVTGFGESIAEAYGKAKSTLDTFGGTDWAELCS